MFIFFAFSVTWLPQKGCLWETVLLKIHPMIQTIMCKQSELHSVYLLFFNTILPENNQLSIFLCVLVPEVEN